MIDCDPNSPCNQIKDWVPYGERKRKRPKKKKGGKNGRKRKQMHLIWPHCYWCGKELSIDESTVEHLIPKSEGGSQKSTNIALSCGGYNSGRELLVPRVTGQRADGLGSKRPLPWVPELCQEPDDKAWVRFSDMKEAAKGTLPMAVLCETVEEAMRLVVLGWFAAYKNAEWVDSVFYKADEGQHFLYVVPKDAESLGLNQRRSVAALGLSAGRGIRAVVNSRVCNVRLDDHDGIVEIKL